MDLLDDPPADPDPDPPLARRTDPDTSHEAVPSKAVLQEREQQAIEKVREAPGLTQAELDRRFSRLERTIGRRLNMLWRKGLIRRGHKRPCSTSGKPAYTWWPNDPETK